MNRIAARLAVTALLAGTAGVAPAQTVYRCGPDGHVYQNAPCNGGHEIDVADPRTDEQRRTAKEDAARQARHAADLARERHEREAATVPATAGSLGPAPALVASAPSRYGYPYRRGHRSGYVQRYFPDGTPVPPVFRAPPAPKPASGKAAPKK